MKERKNIYNNQSNNRFINKFRKCKYKDKELLILSIFFLGLSFLLDKIVIQIVNIIQYPLLFKLFYAITLLGEMYVFIWVALFIILALIITKHPIKKFIITLILGVVSNIILKTLINRPRPFETLHTPSTIITNMSSFPSGHTMIFFVMIPYLSKTFPKIKIIIWTIAILVGISRIYLGVHYFSDVIAGAIFGYFIGSIVLQIGEKNE